MIKALSLLFILSLCIGTFSFSATLGSVESIVLDVQDKMELVRGITGVQSFRVTPPSVSLGYNEFVVGATGEVRSLKWGVLYYSSRDLDFDYNDIGTIYPHVYRASFKVNPFKSIEVDAIRFRSNHKDYLVVDPFMEYTEDDWNGFEVYQAGVDLFTHTRVVCLEPFDFVTAVTDLRGTGLNNPLNMRSVDFIETDRDVKNFIIGGYSG